MTSAAHQIGSLAMRPKEDQGVVDPRLRVYGVKNLRVADVSICPVMVRILFRYLELTWLILYTSRSIITPPQSPT